MPEAVRRRCFQHRHFTRPLLQMLKRTCCVLHVGRLQLHAVLAFRDAHVSPPTVIDCVSLWSTLAGRSLWPWLVCRERK
jgi:hypothetical protein